MDGLEELHNVTVIAATNRMDLVDPALLRPGRFDRHIYIPPPDLTTRKAILAIHTRRKPLGKDVDLDDVARRTDKYTGAELAAVCNEAAMLAIRETATKYPNLDEAALKKVAIEKRHFEAALKKVQPQTGDAARNGRGNRAEAHRRGSVRGRTRGPRSCEPDRYEHRERRRQPLGPPETKRRAPVDNRARLAAMVPSSDRPAPARLRRGQHRNQRRDGPPCGEREGTGRPGREGPGGGPRDRPDHPRGRASAPAPRLRPRGAADGPESCDPHGARCGTSDARPARDGGPRDQLRGEADGRRRRRKHGRALGAAPGNRRGDSRRGGKGVHRAIRSRGSDDPRIKPSRAHKIRETREERASAPHSFLVVHAAELITLRGPPGPRRRETAGDLGLVEDGAVYVEGERIVDVGPTPDVLARHPRASVQIDATGKTVLPGFVDGHTHAVFAGSREHEVEWKAQGMDYREIAARGGGILHTVQATRNADEENLARAAANRLRSMLAPGTTTVEVKSGYGLRTADELKILKAAAQAGRMAGVDVVPTFLGAHAVPPEFEGRPDAYVDLVAEEMIDAVAKERLAAFCDVFVDDGYFSADQGRRILGRAKSAGLGAKIHADELAESGGASVAAEVGAVSADHLLHTSPEGIEALARTDVIAIWLPAPDVASAA